MLKINGSTGGADIIACIVREKSSYPYVERIIGIICYITIAFSYFVYRELDSVLLSVMQTFVYERTIAFVLRSNRNAVECRIITKTPEIIAEDLLRTLKHGATIVESRGVYTGEENAIVFTVINTRQIGEFIGIMKKYPEVFVCYGEVSGVNGNFRRNKNDPLR